MLVITEKFACTNAALVLSIKKYNSLPILSLSSGEVMWK